MPWSEEYQPQQSESQKDTRNEIFNKTKKELDGKFKWVTKFPAEKRSLMIFGALFETLAISENLENLPDTEIQKNTRTLIEELFQKAPISLGEEWASKPDDVSVIFDKDGHLVIDKILEMKTSVSALVHGRDKGQSQHSLETIEKIVKLMNSMIAAPNIEEVSEITTLGDKHHFRKEYLEKIYRRIKDMGINEDISLSPSLQYQIVLPANETGYIPKIQVMRDGIPIEVVVTHSKFSKDDIHSIIDHYQETP